MNISSLIDIKKNNYILKHRFLAEFQSWRRKKCENELHHFQRTGGSIKHNAQKCYKQIKLPKFITHSAESRHSTQRENQLPRCHDHSGFILLSLLVFEAASSSSSEISFFALYGTCGEASYLKQITVFITVFIVM